ncbi:hypothetical protein WJX73_010925 [Symbiochloris irregularis]|uniref:Cryptochrome DASH n=1 Tax=Symbiochloris irregularis TaxID=706552 RepID=A0AAW1PC94_9CHLO
MGGRVILWFRNDLRLLDNACVNAAEKLVQSGKAREVVPLYCFDPRSYVRTPYGNHKTGPMRAKFIRESVADLKANLQSIGSDLAVVLDKPENAIRDLVSGDTTVLATEEICSEEKQVEEQLRRALQGKGQLQLIWDNTLYHQDDLPFGFDDMPDVFSPFKNKLESKCQVRPSFSRPSKGSLPLPSDLDASLLSKMPASVEDLNAIASGPESLSTPQDHPQAALNAKGGETEALARLKHYLWDTDRIADYFNTRNGMLGPDYSTKFSAWLAHGCLSPRTVHHELQKYQDQRTSNKSTYWVSFELTWRDYFRYFAQKHGSKIFHEEGPSPRRVTWQYDNDAFERWRQGKTGLPLVDANMRELAQTGFMSNRGRQNVASFLALDLNQDWRQGADWFESVLVDYDVHSNWGNWVSAAGMTGGRINKFNVVKQSKDYDAEGDYMRTWIPELAKVPAPLIHEPWRMSGDEQEKYGCRLNSDYPMPMKSKSNGPPRDGGTRGGGSRGGRSRGGGKRGNRNKGKADQIH